MSSLYGQQQWQQRPQGPAISSMSLGRAWVHNLTHKLDMAQKHGFKGLELFYEDLEYFSRELEQERKKQSLESLLCETEAQTRMDPDNAVNDTVDNAGSSDDNGSSSRSNSFSSSASSPPTSKHDQDRTAVMIDAARVLRIMCDARSIEIISMQPFYHYEGLLDRALHVQKIRALKDEWLPIAKILGTDLILIPSNFLPLDQLVSDNDSETIITDLREVAELGRQQSPVVRFCYESLAWGTHARRWEDAWAVVQRVNMPNFGICLDAFNIAGLVFADPTTISGCTLDGHEAMARTVQDVVSTLRRHAHKVFMVQVADAEKPNSPLVEGHEYYDPAQPARMSWSRNCRLFYGEKDGYLPIAPILRAIVHDLAYTGWISAELFNRRTTDPDPDVPEEMARRGRESWSLFERDILSEDGDRPVVSPATTIATTTKGMSGPWGQRLSKQWRSLR